MSRKKEDFVRDWLAGRGSREDVEKEIQETVFILSPKHAPHPRKNIDQIFSRLRGGPLSLLPQEDVHEDVEMLFSGAQTSNAIPRGDIASVLNGLKEGPLSVDKEQNHVREDSKESADVIPFRKSWSVWGTVFAAAAVLLLLVQPVVHNPMMMFSQEQNKTESKPMVSKEYEVESVQEEESKENIITFPPSVHKKNTRSTQPKKKEKTKINPTSPRITVPKKRSFRQEEVVSEKKRAQADYFLNEMEDEESISLEDTKKIEQSQEIEKVEKRMEVLEAAPTPATETIAARSQKDENAKDVLSILREEAL
ncbi:MAG: hypothetical protein CL916_14615, partial [Deltaproteobacteria bacterium]|nr:hypothetical protein [Deltaproteobacteria bacterium]